MTRERLTIPRDRDAILADLAELTSYGVAPVDAARRLGVTQQQIDNHLKARDAVERRRRNRVVEGAS